MMTSRSRLGTGLTTMVGALLVATAAMALWLLVAGGVFDSTPLPAPLTGNDAAFERQSAQVDNAGPVRVSGEFQISQPRDPFRPLITPDSPIGGLSGVGGQPSEGFTPSTTITLKEVREVNGELRAIVEVNGRTFDVAEGDTFAGNYVVVSLDEDSGIFSFGDKVFELGEGQQILK